MASTTEATVAVEITAEEVEAIGMAADMFETQAEEMLERGLKHHGSVAVYTTTLRWGELCRAVHLRAGGDNPGASE
jgi:hypothetical protein